MQGASHQAAGLTRLFSGMPVPLTSISVLASPHGPETGAWALCLANALSALQSRVCLVETRSASLSVALGCRPMRGWQPDRSLDEQIIHAHGRHLLSAPGCMAGDLEIAAAVSASGCYDFLVFDGGKLTHQQAAISPETPQTLVILMDGQDVEAVYALHKALRLAHSPARTLILGEGSDSVAQLARHFLNQNLDFCKNLHNMSPNSNNQSQTSSNTLTINSNLTWIVSRIQPKNQKRVANGGAGKSSEEIRQG
jgi:hypothetical protein